MLADADCCHQRQLIRAGFARFDAVERVSALLHTRYAYVTALLLMMLLLRGAIRVTTRQGALYVTRRRAIVTRCVVDIPACAPAFDAYVADMPLRDARY